MPNLAYLPRLATDPGFQARVQAAAVQAALQISGESTNPDDTRSQTRQEYAEHVLTVGGDLPALMWSVAANATILQRYADSDHPLWAPPVLPDQSLIPDGDIEFVMATVWDDVSGAARIEARTFNATPGDVPANGSPA